ADVPACLARAPVNVSGAGEALSPGPVLPPLWATLVNPRVTMPTGPVFRAFDDAEPSPEKPRCVAMPVADYASLTRLMRETRNDLEPFAIARAPVIRRVIDQLGVEPGALAARMSGSGATCFALFASAAGARRAANRALASGWWAMASALHVR
ncbi:MAG: 4-(cytidine 5'-diphospho)-2-C-methyl-D-erythritol kinase, partial [Pseudomonadota bacterium]